MSLPTYLRMLAVSLLMAVAVTTTLPAASSEDALIASMEARLPSLMELKLAGKVGESNLALVQARTKLEIAERRLISNENADRLAHYQLIAQKLNVSVEAVQQKRAEQIRKKSPKGIWIQSRSGSWYRE